MINVVAALAPVFMLIALGWGARAGRLASAEQFGAVNRFGYFVLYPAFLFTLVCEADFQAGQSALSGGGAAGLSGRCGAGASLRLFFRGNGPAFTSVFPGRGALERLCAAGRRARALFQRQA